MTFVKVCGLTSVQDAEMCVEAGVDSIGINFWAGSRRCCSMSMARAITEAVAGRTLVVGLFVDAGLEEILEVKAETGVECVQLHGEEPPELLQPLLPHAYKALRVRGPEVLIEAERYPGEYILLDAFVPGRPGGTGASFDWRIAARLARARRLTLAGGLTAENVAAAVVQVRPYCVDTASGVEHAPGLKDAAKVRAFVQAVRSVPEPRLTGD